MTAPVSWSEPLRLADVARGPVERRLEPDEPGRARIAAQLGLDALPSLVAELRATPWLDGVRVSGRWRAEVTQTCGVTLEPLHSMLTGEFEVRAVPADSPAAPDPVAELGVDPESEDPPDVLEGDRVDLAVYVIEHLALEIDPYARKPGVEFEPPAPDPELSPFAVLKSLKPGPSG